MVVVGDLNDYQFSPALSVLKTGTSDGSGKPTLTDLITTLPANQQYTYDFDGVSEVLDHILITKGIGTFTYQVVHVNAEFANQVSDHDPQVVDIKPRRRPDMLTAATCTSITRLAMGAFRMRAFSRLASGERAYGSGSRFLASS